MGCESLMPYCVELERVVTLLNSKKCIITCSSLLLLFEPWGLNKGTKSFSTSSAISVWASVLNLKRALRLGLPFMTPIKLRESRPRLISSINFTGIHTKMYRYASDNMLLVSQFVEMLAPQWNRKENFLNSSSVEASWHTASINSSSSKPYRPPSLLLEYVGPLHMPVMCPRFLSCFWASAGHFWVIPATHRTWKLWENLHKS